MTLAAAARDTALAERFASVRARTRALAAPLSEEDCQIQSMPDASPVKWHLAHTTWFFETFLLQPHLPGYTPFDPAFAVLFNSYYVGIGARHTRAERGLITRPGLAKVLANRDHVDAAMEPLLDDPALADLIELGLQHEEQHQELILMDLLHAFSCNPALPAYDPDWPASAPPPEQAWLDCPEGIYAIGHDGNGFAFDNESARHRIWLDRFAVSNRLVTQGEYRHFIQDGGYRRPELWLSDGWAMVEAEGWTRPLYWTDEIRDSPLSRDKGLSLIFGLSGLRAFDPQAPLTNISYYEAEAYARWAGARLPSEAEWEVAAGLLPLAQTSDTAWQWTGSAYLPYPGFRTAEGAVGEYNGKFMINQMILRGGTSITPPGHARLTYRNFFPPSARWAFSGIRLARSAPASP